MFLTTEIDKSLSLPMVGRDPLGTQAVWQHRARDIVPCLTAASHLPEGFQILLTALAWWPEFAGRFRRRASEQARFFLLFEQAVARACRLAGHPWRLPGSRRLSAGAPGVWAGLDPARHLLLDNQLGNGTWGIYRGPLINADLLNGDNQLRATLAQAVRQETRHAALDKLLVCLDQALDAGPRGTTPIASRRQHGIVAYLVDLVTRLPSRGAIDRHLLRGPSRLSALLADMAVRQPDGIEAPDLAWQAGQLRDRPLQDALERMQACERYLACLDACFEALCHQAGKPPEQAARNLGIDMAALRDARQAFRESSGGYEALARTRHRQLCEARLDSPRAFAGWLLSHHAALSAGRRASPWLEVREDGRLHCQVAVARPGDEALDPRRAWRNGYYLPTLAALARHLNAGASA